MPENKRFALVGDIGSTNVRFAISDVDEMTIKHFVAFQTSMFDNLSDAIAAYYRSIPDHPNMVGIAVAAPMTGETVQMRNLDWSFTAEDIKKATGAARVRIINDLEALALALPFLSSHDLRQIGDGETIDNAPRLVLGAGTSFGAAAVLKSSGGELVLNSEIGQASFGATDREEFNLLEYMAKDFGHVTVENVLSAGGLEAMYTLLASTSDHRPSAAEIVSKAEHEDDAIARKAVELFVSLLARTAGDAALAFGARGGVYLGGGIAPHLLEELLRRSFQLAFKTQVCTASHPQSIPVRVITANDAGLRGAAVSLSNTYPITQAA